MQQGFSNDHDALNLTPHGTLFEQFGPACRVAALLIAGILLGHHLPIVWFWLVLACVSLLSWSILHFARRFFKLITHRRVQHLRYVLLSIALIATSATWYDLQTHHIHPQTIHHHLQPQSQFSQVRGTIHPPFIPSAPARGEFARFSYHPPKTFFRLRLSEVDIGHGWQPAHGTLLVRCHEPDHHLQIGQQIQMIGWLSAFHPPSNPGEPDFPQIMQRDGLDGRFAITRRDHLEILNTNTTALSLSSLHLHWLQLRQQLAQTAARSLNLGLEQITSDDTVALLNLLLLGQRSRDSADLYDQFQAVGLAHVLAISGAHLAILLGLTWLVAKALVAHPAKATAIVLVVLITYLMIVPFRIPIARAGVMAMIFCLGLCFGRQIRSMEMLAAAAILLLLWRPFDLFAIGFQLSFAVVAGLLLFTRPLTDRLWSGQWSDLSTASEHLDWRWHLGRWACGLVVANVVACSIALPLVAWHFQIVTPWAALMAIFALPIFTMLLGLGFVKITAGLLWPTLGTWLAGPLAWTGEAMILLVNAGSRWPGATFRWPQPPSLAWCIAWFTLLGICVYWQHRFKRMTMSFAGCILLLWMVISAPWQPEPALGTLAKSFTGAQAASSHTNMQSLAIYMIAVGDGSCFVLQLPSGHTLMFDCGSMHYMDIGRGTVVPTLRRLGIRHLDLAFVSHADLDHYGGMLAVAKAIPISHILVPERLLQTAAANPSGAVAYLVSELQAMGIEIENAAKGWRMTLGEVQLEIIWPAVDFDADTANDGSLVLRVNYAGRHIILTGDIQQQAKTTMLERGEIIRADITDLPHHGSYVEASPRWLDAVQPKVVLQSSGPRRLDQDPWPAILKPRKIERFVTAHDGMTTLTIDPLGNIRVYTFRTPSTTSGLIKE